MSTQSYSSIGAGRRRGTAHDDIDRSFYTVGQTLASIVNDPRAPSQSGGFWGLAADATQQLPPPAPPLDPAKYPPVSKADLRRYIGLVHGAYEKFVKDRQSLEAFDAAHQGRRSSGELGLGPVATAVLWVRGVHPQHRTRACSLLGSPGTLVVVV